MVVIEQEKGECFVIDFSSSDFKVVPMKNAREKQTNEKVQKECMKCKGDFHSLSRDRTAC